MVGLHFIISLSGQENHEHAEDKLSVGGTEGKGVGRPNACYSLLRVKISFS